MAIVAKHKGKAGRPSGRFTQHRRLDKLQEVLESHPNGLTMDALAGLMKITLRSVRRYLVELDRHTELESLPTRPGGPHVWRIKPSERGRAVTLRRSQAQALLAVRPLFEALKGSAFYDEVDMAMRQVLLIAQRPTRNSSKGEGALDRPFHERFLFVPKASRNYGVRGEQLDDVLQAISSGRCLRIRYRFSGQAPRGEATVIDPYALLFQDGSLVCLAKQHETSTVRPFAIEKMVETTVLEDEPSTPPEGFDATDFVQGEFGIGPRGQHRVLIEFDARVADELRGRRIHPSQKIATSSDGRMRITFQTHDLSTVAPWVLGFGGAARVIEPPELVNLVRQSLQEALGRYDAKGP